MLQAYSTNLTVSTKDTIAFQAVEAIGSTATATTGGTAVSLNAPGVYCISVSATGTTTAEGTFGIQMLNNSVAVPNAVASNATGAGETASVAFSVLVSVRKSCCCQNNTVAVALEYTGGDGTASVNVVVTKVR